MKNSIPPVISAKKGERCMNKRSNSLTCKLEKCTDMIWFVKNVCLPETVFMPTGI